MVCISKKGHPMAAYAMGAALQYIQNEHELPSYKFSSTCAFFLRDHKEKEAITKMWKDSAKSRHNILFEGL